MNDRASPPPWRVPLVDVRAQNAVVADRLQAAFDAVRESGRFVLGPHVSLLESRLAERVGVRAAVGVASGSDALLLALRALGVGPGHEVVTTPLTFVATAGAVVRAGATVVFADVDSKTLCLDPGATERMIGPRTRAILPVHLFGHAAPMDDLTALARRHGLALVEDAAQAFGGSYRDAQLGSFGDAAVTSFFPAKPLGALGDGGMIFTDDVAVAERCRRLRVHGARTRESFDEVSGNHRLDELQAALLLAKVDFVGAWRDARARHAARYAELLANVADLTVPGEAPWARSAWPCYVVRVGRGRRDAVAGRVRARGIEVTAYYRAPLNRQPAFTGPLSRSGATPVTDQVSQELLALPLYAEMTDDAVDLVVAALRDALAG